MRWHPCFIWTTESQGGEWAANMYGGNENLEAVEFFKHLNSIFKKKQPGVVLIAEESAAWPRVTAPVEEEGLGFDLQMEYRMDRMIFWNI